MGKVTVSVKPKQSTLSKAVKNVKQKLLTKPKKPEVKITADPPARKTREVTFNRGIVYLGHIPHGFFEEQMREFFEQFGKVSRVRVARSKKTGRSRGYGYIEFINPEVAKIAAESMNNYLMCGRLLKATYIPPEKQHLGFFMGRQWSKQSYPRLTNRLKQNRQNNTNVDNKVEAALVERGLSKLSNIEKRLAQVGITYKITPVEVPDTVIRKRKATSNQPLTEIKKKKLSAEIEEPKKLLTKTTKEKLSTQIKKSKKISAETAKGKVPTQIMKKKTLGETEKEKVATEIKKKKTSVETEKEKVATEIKKKKTSVETEKEKVATEIKKKKTSVETGKGKVSTEIKKKQIPAEIVKEKVSTEVKKKKKIPEIVKEKVPTQIKKKKIAKAEIPKEKVSKEMNRKKRISSELSASKKKSKKERT